MLTFEHECYLTPKDSKNNKRRTYSMRLADNKMDDCPFSHNGPCAHGSIDPSAIKILKELPNRKKSIFLQHNHSFSVASISSNTSIRSILEFGDGSGSASDSDDIFSPRSRHTSISSVKSAKEYARTSRNRSRKSSSKNVRFSETPRAQTEESTVRLSSPIKVSAPDDDMHNYDDEKKLELQVQLQPEENRKAMKIVVWSELNLKNKGSMRFWNEINDFDKRISNFDYNYDELNKLFCVLERQNEEKEDKEEKQN